MKYLTPREVADVLKISYEQALSFIKYSGIDHIRIGRQYRVEEGKFNAFLNRKGGIEINLAENHDAINIYHNKN